MPFTPFRYMAWAKRYQGRGEFHLHHSGMPPASLADLGVGAGGLDIVPPPPGSGGPDPAERIAARYGVPDACVLPTCGTHHANFLLAGALAGPGVRVLVERPYYEALPGVFRLVGAEVSFFERRREEGWRLPTAGIREAMEAGTRVVIFSDLHNPTGARLLPDEVAALDAAARASDAVVVVDEVYRDFLRPPVGTVFYEGGPFVATSSLTKVYGLGALRFGWAVAAPEIRERMREINEFVVVNLPQPTLSVVLAAWDRLPALADRNRERAERNGRIFASWVAGRGDIRWVPPAAGISGFLEVPALAGTDDEAWCARVLEETGVGVVPGSMFGAPGSLRISWGLPTERLSPALDRLGAALDAL